MITIYLKCIKCNHQHELTIYPSGFLVQTTNAGVAYDVFEKTLNCKRCSNEFWVRLEMPQNGSKNEYELLLDGALKRGSIERIHDDDDSIQDDEKIIMRALSRGEGDKYGF